MKILLIGHRGTGKTTFLKRHSKYFPKVKHFDLDQEIEKQLNLTVELIFKASCEAQFRQLEHQVLKRILDENQEYVISLGAGFDIAMLPDKKKYEYQIVFITRSTDKNGRIFLDRPDLSDKPPLEQYISRFEKRQNSYRQHADFIYDMPEGMDEDFDLIEKRIFSDSFNIADAIYTLSAEEVSNIKFLMKSFDHIELRTDLLSSEQIRHVISQNSFHHWLVAFREGCDIKLLESLDKNIRIDWDVDLPVDFKPFLKTEKLILSSHADSFLKGIEQLENFQKKFNLMDCHLKSSPRIETFEQLQQSYEWQQQEKNKRSLLPRSIEGKWIWFRQLAKYNQPLNFVKNRLRLPDQPSFYEWLVLPNDKPKHWGAVIGEPVNHSRSPVEHKDYFQQKNAFMTAVNVGKGFSKQDLSFLGQMGMKFLAITSPLKELFYRWSTEKTDVAEKLKSVNTVYMSNKKIIGHNTDLKGFLNLIEHVRNCIPNFSTKEVIVWGGGGTLNMIEEVVPEAKFYSASQAKPRYNNKKAIDPKILVWAAPRRANVQWPTDVDKKWKFEIVIDLNYQENSMGLEFAKNFSIPYFSGIEMFKSQAFEQRIFWQQYISNPTDDKD